LGVIRANPREYVERFRDTIRNSNDLPEIVCEIPTPGGIILAADYKPKNVHELEGDLDALNLIDLDNEGLSEYKQYLKNFGKSGTSAAAHALSTVLSAAAAAVLASAADGTVKTADVNTSDSASSSSGSVVAASSTNSPQYKLAALINKIFKLIDRDECGNVSVSDASAILLRLNSRLRQSYGEDDLINFFNTLDSNKDGKLDLDEFRKAFLNLEF
jgi:Ca2+-binding EF-hand superfamily protein